MAEKTPKKPTRVPRPQIAPADAMDPIDHGRIYGASIDNTGLGTIDEVDEAELVVKRPDRDPMAETPIIVSADHPETQMAHLQQRLTHERQMWLHHQHLAGAEIRMVEEYGLRVNRLYGEIARLNGGDPAKVDAAVEEMDTATYKITQNLIQRVEATNKENGNA